MTAQWLIATPDGPQLRRYCPDCTPTGPVSDLTCTRCGDGPLLAGHLAADQTGGIHDQVRAWLTAAGWCLAEIADPRCPGCRRPGHDTNISASGPRNGTLYPARSGKDPA